MLDLVKKANRHVEPFSSILSRQYKVMAGDVISHKTPRLAFTENIRGGKMIRAVYFKELLIT